MQRIIGLRGPVGLGNTERMAGRRAVQSQDAGAECGTCQRAPRARGMIVTGGCVQRDAGADRDLVADHAGAGEQRPPLAAAGHLQQAEHRRPHGDAGMTLGEHVPVMRIKTVDGRSAGERHAGNTRAAAVKDQSRRVAILARGKMAGREVTRDARQRGAAPRAGDPDQIETRSGPSRPLPAANRRTGYRG